MNRIQRVKTAIGHQPGAGIPTGELTMDRSFMEALLGWKGRRGPLKKMSDTQMRIECSRLLDHDLVCLQSSPTEAGEGDPSAPLREIARMADDGLFVFWIVDGAFQGSMHRHDFMAFMRAIAASPEDVAGEMDASSQQTTARMTKGVAHGAHGIIIADDIAYRKSSYMSPAFGEKYLLPLWRQQTRTARALGVPVFFHSDGNINRFLPLIVEAGFDGLQCIEPAAGMDIFEIRKTYGTRLCLMGNLDPSLLCKPETTVACDAGSDNLDRAVADLVHMVGDSGGLILGTCSGLNDGMSPERVCRIAALASKMR